MAAAVLEDPAGVESQATGTSAAPFTGSVDTLPLSRAFFLDVNIARDLDNDAGHYLAAAPFVPGSYPGTVFYRSSDGGALWTPLATITEAVTCGTAESVLADADASFYDETSSFTVRMIHGSFESATQQELLTDVYTNLALSGGEWLQFANVEDNGDGTVTLSGFLRGRFGTEHETGNHTIGEDFILFSETTWRRVILPASEIGEPRLFRPATVGAPPSGAPEVSFANTARGLKPYAPSHLLAIRAGGHGGAWYITWYRRTRVGGGWQDGVEVPLGEEEESYEVDILNGLGGSVLQTLSTGAPPSLSGVNLSIDGGTQTVTWDDAGDWEADGFIIGQLVELVNFTNAANNGVFRVADLVGSGLTLEEGLTQLVTEPSASGRTVTALNPGVRLFPGGATVNFNVYQLSSIVGRGYAASGSFSE